MKRFIMCRFAYFAVGVVLLVWGSFAMGSTLYVDVGGGSAYTSIQAAIDAAADSGDEIEVAPGTYYENINFQGKAVIVRSQDVATTIIDGGGLGSVVTFNSGENSFSVLDGFTITNGDGTGGN